MYLEDRVDALEQENKELLARLEKLEKTRNTSFVTVSELAKMMHCSPQNIHKRIRAGEIRATRIVGDQRIPLEQFLKDAGCEPQPVIKPAARPERGKSMRELVFGA